MASAWPRSSASIPGKAPEVSTSVTTGRPKRPRSYEYAEELPRSEAGKLLRRILKERYLSPP